MNMRNIDRIALSRYWNTLRKNRNTLFTQSALPKLEETKYYIKFSFKPGLEIGALFIEPTFTLLTAPELLNTVPKGMKTGQYIQKTQEIFDQELVVIEYIHSCGAISFDQANQALQEFQNHYNSNLTIKITTSDPKQNTFIANMINELKKVSVKPSHTLAHSTI